MHIFHFCFEYTDLFIAFVALIGVFLGFFLNVFWDNKKFNREQLHKQIESNAKALKEMSPARVEFEKSIDSLKSRLTGVSESEPINLAGLKVSEIDKFMKDSVKNHKELQMKWIDERDLMSAGLNKKFTAISDAMIFITILSSSKSALGPSSVVRLAEESKIIKANLTDINARI